MGRKFRNRWEKARNTREGSGLPPGWMFGVAWSLLYFLMVYSAFSYFRARSVLTSEHQVMRYLAVVIIHIVQLMANKMWSVLFFDYDAIRGSFYLILLFMLPLAIVELVLMAVDRQDAAWSSFLPYILFLMYAAFLNFRWKSLQDKQQELELLPSQSRSRSVEGEYRPRRSGHRERRDRREKRYSKKKSSTRH
jgi:tryptophan-rich sensory protein